MSGDLSEAIARLRTDLRNGPVVGGYVVVVADVLAPVLDAIEGGKWEEDTRYPSTGKFEDVRRFVGPWKAVDPQ